MDLSGRRQEKALKRSSKDIDRDEHDYLTAMLKKEQEKEQANGTH
jgi:hypothetical protein